MADKKTGNPETPQFDLLDTLSQVERRTETFSETEWELLAQWCSKWVLRQTALLDPRWARLIDAARIETRREDWQLLGAWIARVLENGTHLSAPEHPYFLAGSARAVDKPCEWDGCGKTFTVEYAGQRFCSNRCGSIAFKQARAA